VSVVSGVPAHGGPVLPEFVVAPAHPATGHGRSDVVFEVRQGRGGAQVLPVFSTVRRLVEAMGSAQPWVVLPLQRAREIAGASGVNQVLLDPVAEPGAWQWQPGDLETLRRSLG
jgi:hypothetical protein